MGWVLAQDRALLLAPGPRRGAAGGDRRAEHRRVRPGHQPAPVHADQGGRPDHPAPGRRRAEGGRRRGRGRPARHRRLPRGPQRPAAPGRPGRAAVDAGRHLRRQRDHRPDLRRGRRRRGAPCRVPRPRCASATARAAATGSSTTSPSSRTRIRPRRSARPSRTGARTCTGKGNAVLDAGSYKPTGPSGLGPRGERAPALVEQLPAGRREPLGDRASAVRRRPADRLHVPGPDARGRHLLPRRAGARRDRARASPATS